MAKAKKLYQVVIENRTKGNDGRYYTSETFKSFTNKKEANEFIKQKLKPYNENKDNFNYVFLNNKLQNK